MSVLPEQKENVKVICYGKICPDTADSFVPGKKNHSRCTYFLSLAKAGEKKKSFSIILLYFPNNVRHVQELICQTAVENHSTLKRSSLSEPHSSAWILQISNWE